MSMTEILKTFEDVAVSKDAEQRNDVLSIRYVNGWLLLISDNGLTDAVIASKTERDTYVTLYKGWDNLGLTLETYFRLAKGVFDDYVEEEQRMTVDDF